MDNILQIIITIIVCIVGIGIGWIIGKHLSSKKNKWKELIEWMKNQEDINKTIAEYIKSKNQ